MVTEFLTGLGILGLGLWYGREGLINEPDVGLGDSEGHRVGSAMQVRKDWAVPVIRPQEAEVCLPHFHPTGPPSPWRLCTGEAERVSYNTGVTLEGLLSSSLSPSCTHGGTFSVTL